jgi:Xaa-Pro aminopeptidase
MRKTCQANYRPGITFKAIGEKVRQSLIEKGKDPKNPKVRGIIRYGGYNHSVGLATHDPMGTFSGPNHVLSPGFVFACDIQVIHPEEEIGIRLEDTIAITEKGYINLSEGLPRTIEEIEAFMRKEGILQVLEKSRK